MWDTVFRTSLMSGSGNPTVALKSFAFLHSSRSLPCQLQSPVLPLLLPASTCAFNYSCPVPPQLPSRAAVQCFVPCKAECFCTESLSSGIPWALQSPLGYHGRPSQLLYKPEFASADQCEPSWKWGCVFTCQSRSGGTPPALKLRAAVIYWDSTPGLWVCVNVFLPIWKLKMSGFYCYCLQELCSSQIYVVA